MPRPEVVIRTRVVELGLCRDEYEAFIAPLHAEGIDEDVREERSIEGAVVEVGIWIGEEHREARRRRRAGST